MVVVLTFRDGKGSEVILLSRITLPFVNALLYFTRVILNNVAFSNKFRY